jgi:chromosome segregation ATPase
LEERSQNLQRIAPEVHELEQLKKEMAETKETLAKTDKAIRDLEESQKANETSLKVLTDEADIYRDIAEDVQALEALSKEVDRLKENLEDLQLSSTLFESGRGLEAVQQEDDKVGSELKEKRKELDTKQDLFNSQSKSLNELEAGLNRLVNRKLEVEGQQQARANTLARREELEEKLRKGGDELERCDADLKPVEAALEEKEGEWLTARRQGEQELERLAAREKVVDAHVAEVSRLDQAIQDYLRDNKEAKFQEERQNKKELEGQLRELRERRGQAEAEKQQLRTELASQEARRRTCEDNLKLRSFRREEAECDQVVQEQKSLLDSMDWQAVFQRGEKLMADISRIRDDFKRYHVLFQNAFCSAFI